MFETLRVKQELYGQKIVFGHDMPAVGETYQNFMENGNTAGTPRFTVIDSRGVVSYADFRLNGHLFQQVLGIEDIAFKGT